MAQLSRLLGKVWVRFLFFAGLFFLFIPSAYAGCGIASGEVKVLSNDFPAVRAVAEEAGKCASSDVRFELNATKDHKDLTVAALTPDPAKYSVVILSNATLTPLLNKGLVRPLDDYLSLVGSKVLNTQKVVVDGKVVAIAFMANAQHFFYRLDLLEQAGVQKVPTSYEEVLSAAEALKSKGVLDYPLAGTYKAGWNLAEEFVNMYMGFGGELFARGSAEASVNNEKGARALEMMKSLSRYMNPDYLTHDSNAVQAEWKAGRVAMTNLWGSRAKALLDSEGSTEGVAENTYLSSAPTVGGGSIPATTLWWDGFSIASHISEEDAKASFDAMIYGASDKMANANSSLAVWLIPGHTSRERSTLGVTESAGRGARPYPMVPYMTLLHSALGSELVDFMQGKESAAAALQDVEKAYTTAAREGGYL